MKERIREIITNPIIVILLIAFAVSGVIIYGISSNMAEQNLRLSIALIYQAYQEIKTANLLSN